MFLCRHIFFLLITFTISYTVNGDEKCYISKSLKNEIRKYSDIVQKIKDLVVTGKEQNVTWEQLATFVDTFGSRISGSKNLENSIDFMSEKLKQYGLENVHTEEVVVTHWIRGNESATLIKPRIKNLPMLGLGGSIETPVEGLTAEVVVVKSFEELKTIPPDNLKGKILVFNQEYTSYGETVKYRSFGATVAAKAGAVAVLIRSITQFSISSPHTGDQEYMENVTKIPTACITIEDAEMLHRMYKRGSKLVVRLKMEAHTLNPAISRNTIAEIVGSTLPNKVVLVSGHIDSWDVGQGAMDDGGGAFISWRSLAILKMLNLRPKRTIRCVLWTGEEQGYLGAYSYLKDHENEIDNLTVVIESDEGTFDPEGITFHGSDDASCILQHVLSLMGPLNATTLERSTSNVGSDIEVFQEEKYKVPACSLKNKNDKYFWFHHSEGDTMTVLDPRSLDLNTALFAAFSYIVADLSVDLPRTSLLHNEKSLFEIKFSGLDFRIFNNNV